MEADTLIELKTTDVDGKISFIADLPIDGTYYVKELYAPDGFVTTGEEQEFVFEYQGDKEAEVSYEFVFEDEPTTVELSKTDLTTGEELPGARLQLTDENGAVVEEWTSTKEPHIIKELVVGKSYTLTENKPADGYATAESITFTVWSLLFFQGVFTDRKFFDIMRLFTGSPGFYDVAIFICDGQFSSFDLSISGNIRFANLHFGHVIFHYLFLDLYSILHGALPIC